MSGDTLPALVAAGGGAALLGGIALHERRRDQAMKASRMSHVLTFPVTTEPAAALAALKSLSGIGEGQELVAEVVATADGIHHLLHLPEAVARSVIDQLSAALPGIRVDVAQARSTGAVTAAARITVSDRASLRTDDPVQATRAILEGLGALRDEERISLRWALRPSAAPSHAPRGPRSGPVSMTKRAEERALQGRLGEPGFTCAGLVLARASEVNRARGLVSHVVAVLRSRTSLGRGLIIRRGSVRSQNVLPSTGRSRGWLSAAELLPLLGWPLGSAPIAGVTTGAARQLAVPRGVPTEGRRLFTGRDAYGERPVALSAQAARHHMAVTGASGAGKSVLLGRCILDDITSGYGGVVIDPKSDLASDVLDRIPKSHTDRIVVLDPAETGPGPGLDLLGVGDPDLRSDVVLGALSSIFKDSWGIRTDMYLRLGLRTLSALPSPVLTDWLRLFTEPGFRTRAVGHLRDPLLIGAWQSYEALSAAEQHQHVAAPMAKVISLLSRPSVRGVLAQKDPKLDIGKLLDERKWLLVTFAPGTLGEPAAKLLGAILTYAVWTAVEARAALPASKRTSVFLYLDELQSLANLPFGIEYLFERARGLGCGVTVATQALGRLPDPVRQSLLGNVGTLVTFRAGHDEATRIARELPGLTAQDIQALRRYEVAARVSSGDGGVSVMTGHTEPPAAVTGQAARIKARSARLYGGRADGIDEELARGGDEPEAGVGRTRRSG
jgi:hypothetical protein